MNYRISSKGRAVSTSFQMEKLDSVPLGVEVQLLTHTNVLVRGVVYDEAGARHFKAWCPFPLIPESLR